jgi:hypothetical protein
LQVRLKLSFLSSFIAITFLLLLSSEPESL